VRRLAYEQQGPLDSLANLRQDLKHVDDSGHLVDDLNVIEIRGILLRRLRNSKEPCYAPPNSRPPRPHLHHCVQDLWGLCTLSELGQMCDGQ